MRDMAARPTRRVQKQKKHPSQKVAFRNFFLRTTRWVPLESQKLRDHEPVAFNAVYLR